MGRFQLSRRTLLRGAGGAVLAVPALELMGSRRARAADGNPKRLVIIYGGISIGADGPEPLVVPDGVGAGYDLKRALLTLGADPLPQNPGLGGMGYGVTDHVSIVSGLKIPWDTGGGVPVGGRSPEFHYNTIGPQLSGMRGDASRDETPNGPTVDQIVADAIAGPTTHHSLSYRVQAASYVGANGANGDSARISFRDNGMGGIERIDPVYSPQLAYNSLFSNFAPPDPAEAAAKEFLVKRRRSVVDLVKERTSSLLPKLGAADRQKMQRHLDEIRALETRLEAIPPVGEGSCELPPDPGADPPVEGAAIEYQGQGGDGLGYSQEDLRADVLFDMIRMAFACDQTRVAAVRMSFSQCAMQMEQITGSPGALHEQGHNAQQTAFADGFGWHVKHFARLVAMLRDTPDPDGTPILDNTAIVLLFEGGRGFDPESGTDNKAHSTENMVALVGGHAGGMNPSGGKHIASQEAHPAQVLVSAMNAVGVAQDTETLGEVTGRVDELFT